MIERQFQRPAPIVACSETSPHAPHGRSLIGGWLKALRFGKFETTGELVEMHGSDSASLDLWTRDVCCVSGEIHVGALPFAGSLLVEIAGIIIPNLRLDRVSKFAQCLETKFAALKQEFVRSQLTNENFTDLMEEGVRQAARSLSDERRAYIAALMVNSLDTSQLPYVESRHLLRVSGDMNDIKVS